MRLIDVVSSPWAITPEMFSEVQGIYARHVRGEKIDIAALEARLGVTLQNARKSLEVQDGVAVITLDGVLAKRANFFMEISGGTSMQLANAQLLAALADPAVNAIVLHVDSPGGTVDGTAELANAVFAARGVKPIITIADGTMASAAYWIGSAADKVFIAGPTTVVGSIGVVATHTDWSRYDKNQGIDSIEITAGKYKRLETEGGTLTREGRDVMQAQVNQIYQIFVASVARHRASTEEDVVSRMADGRVFIGDKAIEAGLVDGVSTLNQVIARAAAGEFGAANQTALDGVSKQVANVGEVPMTITVESVKKEHPDVANALIAEGRKTAGDEGTVAATAAGRVEGAKGERERIQAVLEQEMPGHEALVKKLAFDGTTTGAEAAVQVLKAEKSKGPARLADLETDAAAAAAAASGGADPAGAKKPPEDPVAIAAKAQVYAGEQLKAGRKVTAAEAVDHVMKEKGNG